jgi:hypothetical protein
MPILPIAQQYIDALPSEDLAIERFAKDLMMDDPAHHKKGYTQENAVIAAAEAFDVPRARVEDLLS